MDNSRSSQVSALINQGQVMSDMEAEKWFKRLTEKPYTRLYKIEVEEPNEGVESMKPW